MNRNSKIRLFTYKDVLAFKSMAENLYHEQTSSGFIKKECSILIHEPKVKGQTALSIDVKASKQAAVKLAEKIFKKTGRSSVVFSFENYPNTVKFKLYGSINQQDYFAITQQNYISSQQN